MSAPDAGSRGPEVRVGCVARRGDELLLVRRGHGAAGGRWGLPGDAVRPGETLAEAVVRSVAAQTSLDALCGPFIGWAEEVAADPPTLWMCFESVLLGEHRERHPPGEAEPAGTLEHEWVHLEEVGERRLDEGLAEFLAEHDVIDLVV